MVTEDMIDILAEVLSEVSSEMIDSYSPEDFESKEDLVNAVLNNVKHDFDKHSF